MTQLSILICTYNREYILRDCLDSLVAQTSDKSLFEVIVVNNNSKDKTLKIASEYASKYDNFRAVTETNQGLSYARNRGFEEAKYDWVAYLDDDAKAFPNLVERAIETIDTYKFDCLGGMFYPWYRGTKRPKWLAENYGESIKFSQTVAPLLTGYITGCICLFRKKAIEAIGGFPLDLGMNGTNIAYGEETYVQNKLVEKGFTVGFDPELCIDHLVPEYKQKVNWHIKSAYANGRDAVKIWSTSENFTFLQFSKAIMKIMIKTIPQSLKSLLIQKDYYKENFYLDSISPLANIFGYYSATKNNK
ncbi:MAG: glycosyltransferase family 2 protein [Paludibacter sp.]